MGERTGIFAGDDPFEIIKRWLDEAAETEPNDPNAMTLATVDAQGVPNARIVLMNGFEPDALLFYTNYNSVKAQELSESGAAALLFHWKTLRRQIRLRGTIEKAESDVSDAYYASRPLQSRIGAWASDQSQPLLSRDVLMEKVEKYTQELGETPPRPPHWGGFRLRPLEIEFWCDGAFRLHDRFRWSRGNLADGWDVLRLSP